MAVFVERILTGADRGFGLVAMRKCFIVESLSGRIVGAFPVGEETGSRLGFLLDDQRMFVGSWEDGVSCYDISSGKRIWKNARAKKFTYLTIWRQKGWIYLTGVDRGPSVILDLETGKKIGEGEVTRIFVSEDQDARIYQDYQGQICLRAGGGDARITLIGKEKLMGACFGGGTVSLSTMGGHIYCVDLALGEVCGCNQWEGASCQSIGFDSRTGNYFVLLSEFEGEGCALLRLGPHCKEGDVIARFPLVFDSRFVDSGAGLLTSEGTRGRLYDTSDGKVESFLWADFF